MKTKTNILLIIATLFILLFFAACKLPSPGGCPNPPETITIDIDQAYARHVMVYKDYDTIKFLKDNKDTAIFIGGKLQTGYVHGATTDDCPSLKLCQQMIQTFYDTVFKNNFTIKLYIPNIPGITHADFEIIYNNGLFGNTDASEFSCDTTHNHTSQSITVLGKTYCVTAWSITNVTIYYADRAGIVKILWLNSIYEKIP